MTKKMPPDEIREQIKAVEAGFTILGVLEKDVDIVNSQIRIEHAFNRLARLIYDHFRDGGE